MTIGEPAAEAGVNAATIRYYERSGLLKEPKRLPRSGDRGGGVTIEFLYFDGCPHSEAARRLLSRCMAQLGVDARVAEIEGDHPSPSIRIDRVDVMGEGAPLAERVGSIFLRRDDCWPHFAKHTEASSDAIR